MSISCRSLRHPLLLPDGPTQLSHGEEPWVEAWSSLEQSRGEVLQRARLPSLLGSSPVTSVRWSSMASTTTAPISGEVATTVAAPGVFHYTSGEEKGAFVELVRVASRGRGRGRGRGRARSLGSRLDSTERQNRRSITLLANYCGFYLEFGQMHI